MLLDLNMPKLDGFEVLEQMRAENLLSQTKVVVCSTSNDAGDMKRAKAMGVAGYLVKPARFETFRHILDQHTPLKLRSEQEMQLLLRVA